MNEHGRGDGGGAVGTWEGNGGNQVQPSSTLGSNGGDDGEKGKGSPKGEKRVSFQENEALNYKGATREA